MPASFVADEVEGWKEQAVLRVVYVPPQKMSLMAKPASGDRLNQSIRRDEDKEGTH
jgi:hypothetical protein